jgi:hypothetical protein
MAEGEKTHKNGSKLLSIGLPIAVAAASVLGFIYAVGQRTGKVSEVVKWKEETVPIIARMDRDGTISFTHFKTQYDKVQEQQFNQLEELSRARYSMEQKLAHVDDAAKAIAGFDVRLKKLEDEFSHFDVLEVEHRRLTKDFEQLKDEQRRKP